MVEFHHAFCLWIRRLRLLGITDGRFCAEYLINTFRSNICPWNHNRHHCDHQEGHDNLHRILDKGHHITHLQVSIINSISTIVNDQYRYPIHDQHHNGHHEGHAAVDKQVCPGQVFICFLKPLFLMLFRTESPGDHNTA